MQRQWPHSFQKRLCHLWNLYNLRNLKFLTSKNQNTRVSLRNLRSISPLPSKLNVAVRLTCIKNLKSNVLCLSNSLARVIWAFSSRNQTNVKALRSFIQRSEWTQPRLKRTLNPYRKLVTKQNLNNASKAWKKLELKKT